jgi:RNA polymerase sigma-70 factor (ECF subfamily)
VPSDKAGPGPESSGSGFSQNEAREADRLLMARVTQGDAQAFQQLVDAGIDRVLSVARRMLADEAEAEDVAQEVFLRLWRQAEKWEGGRAQVSTWLYRVTVNTCIDRLRARREETVDELPEVSRDATQQQVLEERDLEQYVEAALNELPERQRIALVLFHYEQLSMNDVAEAMDASVEAIESLLARGRRALKKSLKSQWRAFLPDMRE